MKKCIICGEFILDEFNLCFECKQSKEEKEKSYKYSKHLKVNDIYKEFSRESFFRSLIEDSGLFSSGLATNSTWDESFRNSLVDGYIEKIKKGKIEIYYLDVVEHIVKELEREADEYKSFLGIYNKSSKIKRINKYFRFLAYYQALLELKIEHRTT